MADDGAYPLARLLELRDREIDEAQAVLARATDASEKARAVLAEMAGRLVDAREARAAASRLVAGRTQAGLATAGDLARGASFDARLAGREARALARVREGELAVRRCETQEETARAAVGAARAARQAVERHEEGWQADRRRLQERREE
jgi:flagellar biosynthesis chaperone FliJ